MSFLFTPEEFNKLKNILIVYQWGLKAVSCKLEIIDGDFTHFRENNPIEHIKGRIKSPESIAGKLQKAGRDITAANAKKYVRDIAGIRVICSYAKDIYDIAGILRSLPDIEVLEEKDYVAAPKPSGYRSYHMILKVPVFYSDNVEKVPLEVQLRTQAMDFWASLEHKVRYKYQEHIPQHLCDELVACAERSAELDNRMFLIHDIISLINQE